MLTNYIHFTLKTIWLQVLIYIHTSGSKVGLGISEIQILKVVLQIGMEVIKLLPKWKNFLHLLFVGTQILLSLVIANFCVKFFYSVELRSGLVRQEFPEKPIDTLDDIDYWQNELFVTYSRKNI